MIAPSGHLSSMPPDPRCRDAAALAAGQKGLTHRADAAVAAGIGE